MAEHLQLPDGRNIDYLVTGAPEGFPFVYFHGTPSSCIPDPDLVATCEKKNVKLIMFSRAGHGGSSRNKGRCVKDTVADTQALLDQLGIEKCVVGGWSGGGPHALASAARLKGCVASLCVAGVAPWNAEGLDFMAGQGEDNIEEFRAAQEGEEALQRYCNTSRTGMLQADGALLTQAMSSILPEVDMKAMLENPHLGDFIAKSMHESLRISSDGWVDDDLEFIKPWGFELSEIKVPVLVYQGSEDKMVPYGHGLWLAENLPSAKVAKHFLEGEGHISVFLGQRENMVDELLAMAKL